MERFFRVLAEKTSDIIGSPWAFLIASLFVIVWFIGGAFVIGGLLNPVYQLVINTGTTIITFLVVFLIQNTQNVTDASVQLKLDELIRATNAHNEILRAEKFPQGKLKELAKAYQDMATQKGTEIPPINPALETEE